MSKLTHRGRVVAVTGGGRGIGLAIAKAFAAQGAHVSVGDIDAELAIKAASQLGGHGAKLDVRDRSSFAAFLDSAQKALGPIDVLVNNAGIMPMGRFLDETDAISDTQININLRGVMIGMKLALPAMLERRSGHIVNVASLAGRYAVPGAAVYCATKYAVVGLTEAVREEFRDSGLHFTTVLPSRVSTELSAGTGRGIPTATPEEVAEAVLHAIQHRLVEVTAPRYLGRVSGLYGVTPDWITTAIRRLVGDNRIITSLDRSARVAYEQRVASLVPAATAAKSA